MELILPTQIISCKVPDRAIVVDLSITVDDMNGVIDELNNLY